MATEIRKDSRLAAADGSRLVVELNAAGDYVLEERNGTPDAYITAAGVGGALVIDGAASSGLSLARSANHFLAY